MNRNQLQGRREINQAIQSMGPGAAPYIVQRLKTDDSAWNRNYRSMFPKFPALLAKILPTPTVQFTENHGTYAFLQIGPSAKSALVTALKDENLHVRSAAALTLGALAHYYQTDISDATPALIDALQDTDVAVRLASASALSEIGPRADSAVPALILLLRDPEIGRQKGERYFVRSTAARALGNIGPKAKNAIPSLKTLLTDSDAYNRSLAAIAIWKIDSDVTNTLPVLIQGLNQVGEGGRWELLEALEEMGPRAVGAIPYLSAQLNLQQTPNTPSSFTLSRITNALIKIDLQAAVNAGVRLPSHKEQAK